MTVIIVLVLAAAWGFLLVPDLLSRRGGPRSGKGFGGAGGFSRSMPSFNGKGVGMPAGGRGPRATVVAFPGAMRAPAMMARPRPTGPLSMPSTPDEAARRRIYVLSGLIAFAFFTLALTLAISRAFIVVHLVLDLALVLFVYMLFERRAGVYEEAEYEEELDEVDEYDDLDANIAVGQG